jgi:hypothetical protein
MMPDWVSPSVVMACGREGLGDLQADCHHFIHRDRALRDAVGKRWPLDQLHDQGSGAVVAFEPVDGGDVGVIQRREDLGFTSKPGEPLSVRGHRVRQDLDGDLSLEPGVQRPVHLPHPANSNLRGDLVGADAGAGRQGHGGGPIIGFNPR